MVTMVAAGVLSAVAASTAHAVPCPSGQLVGRWAGTVTHGGTTGAIELIFTPSGKACLITDDGVSKGSWKSTGGAGDFNYQIAEPMLDDSGAQIGWIYVDQDTAAVSSTLTSTGMSRIYDMAGNFQFSQAADVDAHRVAGAPSC